MQKNVLYYIYIADCPGDQFPCPPLGMEGKRHFQKVLVYTIPQISYCPLAYVGIEICLAVKRNKSEKKKRHALPEKNTQIFKIP